MSCLVSHRAIIYRLQEHTVSQSTNQRCRGMFAQGHFCPRKILPQNILLVNLMPILLSVPLESKIT